VGVDGSVSDSENSCDLPIGFAFGCSLEDFQLARRECSTFHLVVAPGFSRIVFKSAAPPRLLGGGRHPQGSSVGGWEGNRAGVLL
jgi:hypothetical protein